MMFKKINFIVALLAAVILIKSPVYSQSRSLIEVGRTEGKVVVYGSLESDTTDAIKKEFQKKTGILAEYWRASATKVMDRALSEYRVGKPLFDVVLTSADPMELMYKEGLFAKYNSPSAQDFPREAIDPNLGPRYRNIIIGVVYNKGIIKPVDAPKSLEDLVNHQYKGKLVMPDPTQHTTTTQWLASLDKLMGKEKADKVIRELAATKPIFVESFLPAAERITTGETPIAITFVKYVYIHGKKGVPLDYVRSGKFLGDAHYVALSKKAAHPNAGKAFIDYFLNDESMGLMAKLGEFVNRKGVYPPVPDADKIQFVRMIHLGKKGFAEKKKEYAKLFLQ